jgi:hypothetical protein
MNKKIILLLIMFVIPNIFSCIEINSSDVNTEFFVNSTECVFITDLNITINGKNPIYIPKEYNFSGGENNTLNISEYNITINGLNQTFNNTLIEINESGIIILERFNLTINTSIECDVCEVCPSCVFEKVNKTLNYGESYSNRNITCIAPLYPSFNTTTYTLNYGETKTFSDRNVTCVAPKTCATCPVCPVLTALDVTLQPGETKTYEANKVKMTCNYAIKEIYKSSFDLNTTLLENCANTITLSAGTGDKVCIDNLNDFCITDMVKTGNLKGCVEYLDSQVVNDKESCVVSLNDLREEYENNQKELELASLRLNDRESSDRNIIVWLILASGFVFLIYAVYNVYTRMKVPKDDSFTPELNIEMPKNVEKLSRRDELE